MSANEAVLMLERVSKRFGDFEAVHELSLSVPRGCVCGFLGPNGAGKTTTIRMILGIYEPSEGRIDLLGHPSALAVRDRIGYLPEEKGLYKKMKAADLVAYFGTLKGLSRAEAQRRARALLTRYGLGEWVAKRCDALSKGMQQKVQVLASIVHQPEFVILDEPFSGLDPVNQQVMESVIADLKAAGTTVIFSTHVMDHAERLCDRVVLIAKGRKLLDGTVLEARRSIPQRVRIETPSDPAPLSSLPGVRAIHNGSSAGRYEIELGDGASADDVLAACFKSGLELRSFDRSEPGLRDVFLAKVGALAASEDLR